MKKDPNVFLGHILDSIEDIETYIRSTTKQAFLNDTLLQDGVIRKLEIIGEATKNIPSDFKNNYPQIEWRTIAGLRDKLTHEYFGVDLNLVWTIAQKDLPILKNQVEKILK